ncbi:MAG: N-formylglutamate amidohydrolase, partial [Proteobacteria bacterium]|nr:N-formylglutamate amidohydrolase [Pseudomonadota bacterium]
GAVDIGAPLLHAHFPRAYVDPNREAYELDPAMFEDVLPGYVNTTSVRVTAGLGTVARVVTNGEEIYGRKLKFVEALNRIEQSYKPYHEALKTLIEKTTEKFGVCFLIDCHSMPSVGGPMDDDRGLHRVDFILGDCHGRSCSPSLTTFVDKTLRRLGGNVRRNDPYSGGFTTRHYGRPQKQVHALQIEINRELYMDEILIEKTAGFAPLAEQMTGLIEALADSQLALPTAAE